MAATFFTTDISRGSCAMYCPEVNGLVPSHQVPRSKTPAFKHLLAKFVRLGMDW